jgi:hypothetical protein
MLPLKPRLVYIIYYLKVEFLPQRKQYISITELNCLMLFRETNAVYSENRKKLVRFQVLKTAFWDIAPCNLVEVD